MSERVPSDPVLDRTFPASPLIPAATVRELRGVVFDMDGLLLNTETLAREAFLLAADEMQLPIDDALCRLMIGMPSDACRQLVVDRCGADVPVDALFERSTLRLHESIDAGAMRLMPGAQALIDALREAGVPRAVATSSSRDKAAHHLERAGILGAFDTVVTRDDVSRGKPHPDLYLEAAQRLAIPPARCLALEDSYNGVRAAHAAGMPVVMVPDLLAPSEEMRELALAVAPSLHAVVQALQERIGRPSSAEGAASPLRDRRG